MEDKRRWLRVTCTVWGGDRTYNIFADPNSAEDICGAFRERGGFEWYAPLQVLKVNKAKPPSPDSSAEIDVRRGRAEEERRRNYIEARLDAASSLQDLKSLVCDYIKDVERLDLEQGHDWESRKEKLRKRTQGVLVFFQRLSHLGTK
ncbi:MAG: hypothetical protein F6J93_27655 [Oscillatoria sp. SIO1A7]|nr:hypothetical protein [Oscillatoria sp. SIO1A7]